MTEPIEQLWSHKLCCVGPINVDPDAPERFDSVLYDQQLEHLAASGCHVVVSPSMSRVAGDRMAFFTYHRLAALAPDKSRIHMTGRPV